MKKLALLAVLVAQPLFATNVSFHAQVVSALNPHVAACVAGHDHYNDVVSSCHAGSSAVQFVAVADSDHCSHNDLVRFVRNPRVRVVVRRRALVSFGLSDYNDTVAQCVKVVKVKNKVVSRRVVRRARLRGVLVGKNARVVKSVVDSCR